MSDYVDYFELSNGGFAILDIEGFMEKTKALAIDVKDEGVAILDGESLEWYYLPFRATGRRRNHLTPVT